MLVFQIAEETASSTSDLATSTSDLTNPTDIASSTFTLATSTASTSDSSSTLSGNDSSTSQTNTSTAEGVFTLESASTSTASSTSSGEAVSATSSETATPAISSLTALTTPDTASSVSSFNVPENDEEDVVETTEETAAENNDESKFSPSQLLASFLHLKERKYSKTFTLDQKANHFCAPKNFSLNLSGQEKAITELELGGKRIDAAMIEIGSLPPGIDITFLASGDYVWRPLQDENTAILYITNQPGSQKGNFSIPIIYTSGNSTTVCQINVINF
jgi:hypothetical protein